MSQTIKIYVLLLLALTYAIGNFAQATQLPPPIEYQIKDLHSIQKLPTLKWMIKEGKTSLTIEDIIAKNLKDAQTVSIQPKETMIDSHTSYWYALKISADVDLKDWLIYTEESKIGVAFMKGYPKVVAYFIKDNEIIAKGLTGNEIANSKRDIASQGPMQLHTINLNAADQMTIWFQLQNNEFVRVVPTLSLYNPQIVFPDFSKDSYFSEGLHLGIKVILLFITLLLWFRQKEKVYAWFIITLSLLIITDFYAVREEWLVDWWIPENRDLGLLLLIFLVLSLRIAILQFGRVLLNLKEAHPKLDSVFKYLIWFSLFLLGTGLCLPRVVHLLQSLWGSGFLMYNLITVLVCLRLLFIPDILTRLYGFGISLLFLSAILPSILENLNLSLKIRPDTLAPIGMMLTLLFALIYRFWQTEEEKANQLRKINIASSKFVPKTFLNFLGKENILDATLGDYVEKQVSVLFSDIRDYTTLSEQMTPEENFRFVNAYNRRMGPIIQQHNGFVNQYLGDGLMAIFPENTEGILKAAVEMQQTLQVYNQQRIAKNKIPIRMGIGIHAGPLIMGIIGDEQRMDAATISDTVNVASRVEGLTKHFGVNILLSEAVLENLPNRDVFNLRYLGLVQVKGKQEVIKIYECFDGDVLEMVELKKVTLADFDKGIKWYYQQDFKKALSFFEKILSQNPKDKTAQFFITKIRNLTQQALPKDWTGVEMMEKK